MLLYGERTEYRLISGYFPNHKYPVRKVRRNYIFIKGSLAPL
ncbi:hypothetical protein L21TH_2630 [Caldisalinibacter kiritimatiensis]|uniref:Uncharacterized protein n=1 Tax=Caldisalinibacter kiritimatiensis TaxID=1304284 RepID=R1AQH0_9FIRM|nr:hypothetical protein L21TH_2630 [Caldisalinibacter kiritimatiensis]